MRVVKTASWRTWIILFLLCAFTAAVYSPAGRFGFINYDDPQYISENPQVLAGLSWAGVKWAFTSGFASNWHPMTWISHMLDVQVFGANPGSHHLTNLLLHVVSSLLLFFLLRKLTRAFWRSVTVAALFALHPLHVESVAWLAERKDVLSGFFFMLTLWAYARYALGSAAIKSEESKIKNYCLPLLFFALGLMSKPMLVTLPFILLLLDYWPLRRFRLKATPPSLNWPILKEKLPFFALSVASSWITLSVQSGAMVHAEGLPFSQRVANALLAYTTYLSQAFWPVKLAVFYPYPPSLSTAAIIAAAAALLAITLVCLWVGKSRPFAFVGWFWYLGMLVPVIGLVQVGSQARADRYTYLPVIGIFILVVWGAHSLIEQYLSRQSNIAATPTSSPGDRVPAGALLWPASLVWSASASALVIVLTLAFLAHQQVKYWKDSEALFAHANRVTKENYIALTGLGIVDLRRGDFPSAMTNLNVALECSRSRGAANEIKYYIGAALQMQGKGREALSYLQQAEVGPDLLAEKNCRLGVCLVEAGRIDEGEAAIKEALALKPYLPDAQLAMAGLLQMRGKSAESEAAFRSILQAHPELPQAHSTYADFLMLQKRPAEAEVQYAETLKLAKPDLGLLRSYAGSLTAQYKNREAVHQLELALNLAPSDPQANFELADVLSELGRKHEALTHYNRAIESNSKFLSALNNCAWMLATDPDPGIRDGKRAVVLAEQACQANEWKAPFLMGTLAAAYAEAGRFEDAVKMAEKARDQARAEKQEQVAKRNEELLELYRSGKAFRDVPTAGKPS